MSYRRWWCGLVCGLSLVAIGATSELSAHAVLTRTVPSFMTLATDGLFYKFWDKPTEFNDLYEKLYFFNITNPHDVVLSGARPIVTEIGPFTYRERRPKWDVLFAADGVHAEYRYNRTFEYVSTPCAAGIAPKDQPRPCSVPNSTKIWSFDQYLLGVFTALQELGQQPGITPKMDEALAELSNLVIDAAAISPASGGNNKSSALMNYVSVLSLITGSGDYLIDLVEKVLPLLRAAGFKKLPHLRGQTAMLWNANPLPRRVSIVDTGNADIQARMQFSQFAGMRTLQSQVWPGTAAWPGTCANDSAGRAYTRSANAIRGVDGNLFPPNLNERDVLTVIDEDVLRKLDLVFKERVTFKGLDAFKFVVDPTTYLPTSAHAPNCAFGNLAPHGVFNVTSYKGAPVFISKPLFLDAHPSYRTNVQFHGVAAPTHERHDMKQVIEPRLGIPLHVMKRAQINLHVWPQTPWTCTKNLLQGGFFSPLVWVEEVAQISEKELSGVKLIIQGSLVSARVLQVLGLGVGGAIVALCILRRVQGRVGNPAPAALSERRPLLINSTD